ncbi:MAG: PEP-CTERM sorting domain-containing protein [Verrucomicrobiota bacterium]
MTPLSLRPVFLATACGLALAASAQAANFSIASATALFTPSTRNQANSTYFGWSAGNWDGNADAATGQTAIPDTLKSTPSNIGWASSIQGTLTQNNVSDIVSGSNNLYGGVPQFNLTLHIPTNGTAGTGSTTIILQGFGLSGSSFGGAPGGMDTFVFGDINGVSPVYTGGVNTGGNLNGQTQFWAEYHIPGNLAAYEVNVLASAVGLGVVSVTDFSVDTWYSPNANTYGPDTVAVPEPASALLGAAALGFMVRRRR